MSNLVSDEEDPKMMAGRWLSFVGKFCSSAAFAVFYVFAPELFPTTVRAAGMGWVSVLDALAGFCAPYMAFSKNQNVSYFIYGSFSLASR